MKIKPRSVSNDDEHVMHGLSSFKMISSETLFRVNKYSAVFADPKKNAVRN